MTHWNGTKDFGSALYRPDEYAAVTAVLAQLLGPERARTIEEIVRMTGINS
jgi:hypothetical protein